MGRGRKQRVYEIYRIHGDELEYLEKGQVNYICQKYGICYQYLSNKCSKTGEATMYDTFFVKRITE